jgi:hypothetical protein
MHTLEQPVSRPLRAHLEQAQNALEQLAALTGAALDQPSSEDAVPTPEAAAS